MARINRRERWSSGMDVLNVTMPPSVSHKTLLNMNRQLYLTDFKFKPVDPDMDGREQFGSRSVRDIIEFLGSGVRFIVMEDGNLEICCLVIEFIDKTTRRTGERPGVHFEMRENRG